MSEVECKNASEVNDPDASPPSVVQQELMTASGETVLANIAAATASGTNFADVSVGSAAAPQALRDERGQTGAAPVAPLTMRRSGNIFCSQVVAAPPNSKFISRLQSVSWALPSWTGSRCPLTSHAEQSQGTNKRIVRTNNVEYKSIV